MKLTQAKLRQNLKNRKFAPVYLFHGEESYLAEQAFELARETLLEGGDEGFDLEVFNAAESTPDRVHSALAQMSLLGGRWVVAVRHLEEVKIDWLNGLLETIQEPPANSHLILYATKKIDARTKFYKAVTKAGDVMECRTLGEKDLLDWLAQEARAQGLAMDEEARLQLLARVGTSLSDLAGEVEKLALFVHPATEITRDDVGAASAAWRGYTNFDLGDAVGERNGLKALAILHHLIEAGDPGKLGPALVGVLAHRLRNWWQARALLDQGLSPGRAAKVMPGYDRFNLESVGQAENFSMKRLARAVERLHRTDLALKTGAPVRERLEGYILWLCG